MLATVCPSSNICTLSTPPPPCPPLPLPVHVSNSKWTKRSNYLHKHTDIADVTLTCIIQQVDFLLLFFVQEKNLQKDALPSVCAQIRAQQMLFGSNTNKSLLLVVYERSYTHDFKPTSWTCLNQSEPLPAEIVLSSFLLYCNCLFKHGRK